jgi:uncharacterized protein YjbI with pentapeptide repeats
MTDSSCSAVGCPLRQDPDVGDGLCPLHSKSPGKDPQSVALAIDQKTKNGDFDFSGCSFPDDPPFAGRDLSGAVFAAAEFQGRARFENAKFLRSANFRGVAFMGDASFADADFAGPADFEGCAFHGLADFQRTRFSHVPLARDDSDLDDGQGTRPGFSVNFEGVRFDRGLFGGARFGAWANFNRTEFVVGASFNGARFLGGTVFPSSGEFRWTTETAGYALPVDELTTPAEFGWPEFDDRGFSVCATFREARFGGVAEFVGVDFGGRAGVDFRRAQFAEAPEFQRARFSAWAAFRETWFGAYSSHTQEGARGGTSPGWAGTAEDAPPQHARFGRAKFEGRAHFVLASFQAEVADFGQTRFLGPAEFGEAEVDAEALFERAEFARAPDFAGAKFPRGVSFEGVQFPSATAFERVCWATRVTFANANLEGVGFRSVDLQHCRFAGCRNLDRATFDDVDSWASWPPARGEHGKTRRAAAGVGSNWFRRPAVADEIDARTSAGGGGPRLKIVEGVYRAIRLSYEARADHPRARPFYFGEMEMRRLAMDSRLARTCGSLTAWYGLLSGYGERWLRPLMWFFALVLLWGLLYANFGLWLKPNAADISGIAQSQLTYVRCGPAWPASAAGAVDCADALRHALLHSTLVATLVGREAYAYPATWPGHVAQAIEAVVGPLLVVLVGLAIGRSFRR